MSIQKTLETATKAALQNIYDISVDTVEFQATRKDFEGDITIVVFPFLRKIKGNPVEIGKRVGAYLKENIVEINDFNVVKGFLNLVLSDSYLQEQFYTIFNIKDYGISTDYDAKAIMVEYSSPNTNKPLHLGHIRNNLLGYSVAEILKAAGNKVYKTQIINDRGIHICKSMLAYQKFGNGETPESTGLKGDKLIGNYYVKFDQEYKKEISRLVADGLSEEEAKKQAPLLLEAQEMLKKWEREDTEVRTLWGKMNQWVYDGFDVTYKAMGVDFDINYFESNTYLLGKDIVQKGLDTGVFFKKPDGSVWIDLSDEGLDEKIVLRADGTAVYITQDIGTAIQRVKDYPDVEGMVYTVGNEQDYHFKVLFLILKKLGYEWASNLYHLSYGMVDLPEGKMKSREGTVVDADDLMQEMTDTARAISQELGKLEGYTDEEKENLYHIIGLGALKYFILKVDPKKRILFDPKESIDFNGNTGPFIQYTYARIQSLLRRAEFDYTKEVKITLQPKEREVIKLLQDFPEIIQNAAQNHSPALIANFTYDLVKAFNSFYQSVSIFSADSDDEKIFRIQLSKQVGDVIQRAFALLGIAMPDRM
jgi:arginyl-tRNA synthetase